jgi:hypothetical protein
MYVSILENRLSLTVIEIICADGTEIPPVIIVPGNRIMESWFHKNMTGHELMTVSPTGYTNEIKSLWLDHFIKHRNCGLDSCWQILVFDGAASYIDEEFVLKRISHKIQPIIFPSHQTHLI